MSIGPGHPAGTGRDAALSHPASREARAAGTAAPRSTGVAGGMGLRKGMLRRAARPVAGEAARPRDAPASATRAALGSEGVAVMPAATDDASSKAGDAAGAAARIRAGQRRNVQPPAS